MDDHILRDIPSTIQYIQKVTGHKRIHWVGHSMGGMLLYAHDAVLGSADLASGTTLGSPIGFEGVPFHRPGLALALRKTSRLAFRCLQRLVVTICHLFKPQLALIPVNYKNMNPILDASAMFSTLDAPPIGVSMSLAKAAETHTWRVNDETVNVFDHLKDLKVPLFAIFGAGDPFVPVEHAKTFFDEIRNTDKRLMVLSKDNGNVADYSHVDLVFGREAKREVFTPVVEWLAAHPIAQRVVVEEEVTITTTEPAPAPQPVFVAD
ncbi:MAG: alpha/beta hydrolase, partial [Candidatus Hydrogenedentes bacterium]|nr:alpha/beta hydrolase [Candidatus Hydrogenedentota bacterium]